MRHLNSRLLAVLLLGTVVVSHPTALGAQSAAPAAATGAAAVDVATLEKKVDELLAAHPKVNDFSGTVLIASQGKPLFAKGVRLREHRMADPEHDEDEVPHRLDHQAVHVDADHAAARAGQRSSSRTRCASTSRRVRRRGSR